MPRTHTPTPTHTTYTVNRLWALGLVPYVVTPLLGKLFV
ncbi:predicted protein [Plenodomus lingam JN3]|uniref:Predicted protein n=1 Tax=Leptosphaeria maculans (strain JN3 / isolate v23.1.3 / race Av1-4-5-6-7-8) TaxID=985895 RepID=E4ZHV2_LEPMJ|nr:predicted protein [Plenodomus lingam JN3]CBX90935.1 predicted protein [Plenodomus lingam JN3]